MNPSNYRYIGPRPRPTNAQFVLRSRGLIANTPTGEPASERWGLGTYLLAATIVGSVLGWAFQ